jgi:release factor glutamine methyltransferase
MANREINIDYSEMRQIISRINRHEPIQYITEVAWFFDRQFFVNPSVLIPRPETEIIVDYIFKATKEHACVLDLGTGSGCIAISIKLTKPNYNVWAIDISEGALAVAKKNAALLGAAIFIQKHNFLDSEHPLLCTFDYIVSNPPYVLENEKSKMEETVLAYEPHLALFVPNNDPLLFYRALVEQSKKLLNPCGEVVAEINPKYAAPTSKLFSDAGFVVEIRKDLEGKDRTIVARLMN